MSLLLEHPVPVSPAKDIRSQSVDKLRAKERRVKYRYANANLLGTPVKPYQADLCPRRAPEVWNSRNAWKMRAVEARCRCTWCRGWNESVRNISQDCLAGDVPLPASKKYRPASSRRDPNDVDENGVDDEMLLMETDIDTQLALSHAVALAVEKFEVKELNNLVKNEYEVIVTPSIDAEDFVFV